MSGADLIELLVTTAAGVAMSWMRSEAEDRAELENRALAALAVLCGERAATAAAHDARTRATDDAIEAARKRLADMSQRTQGS